MNIEIVALDTLTLDPFNLRTHNEKNLEAIQQSLAAFGQQVPLVVDARNIVLKGNGSLICMRRLGWKECAIHRTTLEGAQSVHFAIADNRTAELAGWNFEQLTMKIKTDEEFTDHLLKYGWTDADVAPLRLVDWDPTEPLTGKKEAAVVPPVPLLFLDFTGEELSELQPAMCRYREIHRYGDPISDSQVIVKILLEWERAHGYV